MFGPTKPLYDIQRKLTYQRHLKRLDQISKERSIKVTPQHSLKQMHSIRIKSSQFHTVEHVNALNHENGKMIDSLLKIARRKSVTQAQQPSMHYYHNRSRKEHAREIARNNYLLADRILRKQSQFDPVSLKKHIDSYQQMKRRMQRNKKATLPQLQELSRAGSQNRSRKNSRAKLFEDSS